MNGENFEIIGMPAAIDVSSTEPSTTQPEDHNRLHESFVEPLQKDPTVLGIVLLGIAYAAAVVIGRNHMDRNQ